MNLKIEAPQLILTAMMLIGMGVSLSRYGQQKKDTYDSVDCIIAPAIMFFLLWWGGFYG